MDSPVAPAVELRAVSCARGAESLHAISARFAPATFHLLGGPPGCGRELLLRVLGALEKPDHGEVLLEGQPTSDLSEEQRAELRGRRCGFVFRAPFLLPAFSVVENLAMPLFRLSQMDAAGARRRTDELLDFVGLADSAQERIEELPLEARHRVSLARGLINAPALLLVEALDLAGAEAKPLAGLLRAACRRFGVTVIAIHSGDFAVKEDDCLLEVAAGALVSPEKVRSSFP